MLRLEVASLDVHRSADGALLPFVGFAYVEIQRAFGQTRLGRGAVDLGDLLSGGLKKLSCGCHRDLNLTV